MKVSVAVMAHRSREHFVSDLLDKLDAPAQVVWDRYNDRWETGSRALRAREADADYHLVVQDDAIVCRDLVAGVARAVEFLAHRFHAPIPMCLYMGRRYRQRCLRYGKGTSWFTMPLQWGVAIVLPADLTDDAVAWGDSIPEIQNYDVRLQMWLRTQMLRVWYPWPSFVNHRSSPSLVPGRGSRGRYALRFIGKNASALDFDLTGRVVHRPDRLNVTVDRTR